MFGVLESWSFGVLDYDKKAIFLSFFHDSITPSLQYSNSPLSVLMRTQESLISSSPNKVGLHLNCSSYE